MARPTRVGQVTRAVRHRMSESQPDDRALEICRSVAKIANAVRSGELKKHGDAILDAKTKEDFQTCQSTMKFLSRNSWSAKWSAASVEMLKKVQFFHVERLSYAQKEYAREQCTFHCTLCGTEESQCSSVVHLLGNIDGDYNSDSLLDCRPCNLPAVYDGFKNDELNYIGLIVPGCSCLGLCIKTLTSNLMLARALNEASGDVEAEATEIAETWRSLHSANGASSAVFEKLVRFSDDVSPVFTRVFGDFQQRAIEAQLLGNFSDTEIYLDVLSRASLKTQATIERMRELLGQQRNRPPAAAAGSSSRSRDKDEIDIANSDDEEDDEGGGESDWLVDDDEGEECDEEEEDPRRCNPIRGTRHMRRVVDDDTDDEEEDEGGEGVHIAPNPPPPPPRRETRASKRAREEQETERAQNAVIDAAARPSRGAAVSLRIHPGNALHSREQTLADLLTLAAKFSLRQQDLQHVPALTEGATALAKLLDGKKRGIDYQVNVQGIASRLAGLYQLIISKGRIGETAPVAAALLVLAEFS